MALLSTIGISTDNAQYKLIKNPVTPTGGDPYVTELDGKYYYCYSGGNSVYVNKIDSLDTITTDGGITGRPNFIIYTENGIYMLPLMTEILTTTACMYSRERPRIRQRSLL